MISIKYLKEFIEKDYDATDVAYLQCQGMFEAYIKRLLFISLRLHGIQYQYAREIITDTSQHMKMSQVIGYSINRMLKEKGGGRRYEDLRKSDKRLEGLQGCVIKFCRPVRNKIAHGAKQNLNPELLTLCSKITQEFVRRIEYNLKKHAGLSALDTPGEWGAERSMTNNSYNDDLRGALGFAKDKRRITIEDVQSHLKQHRIKLQ